MERDGKIELLRRVPMFAELSGDELTRIGSVLDVTGVDAGEHLTEQGRTPAHQFFIVVEGAARVRRDGEIVAELGPGDIIGELAIMDGDPRSATVVAAEPMRLLVGHRNTFAAVAEAGTLHELIERTAGRRRRANTA